MFQCCWLTLRDHVRVEPAVAVFVGMALKSRSKTETLSEKVFRVRALKPSALGHAVFVAGQVRIFEQSSEGRDSQLEEGPWNIGFPGSGCGPLFLAAVLESGKGCGNRQRGC